MSQVSLITSAHCQAFNAHHLQCHKWVEDQSSSADQIKFAADGNHHFLFQTDLCQIPPLYFSDKQWCLWWERQWVKPQDNNTIIKGGEKEEEGVGWFWSLKLILHKSWFQKLEKKEQDNQESVGHFLQTYSRLNTFSLPQPKYLLSLTKHLPK